MLSSTLPSSPHSDFHYFPFENSSKKLQQMVPDIGVTTRRAWKSQMIREQEAAGSQAHLPPPTPVSAETSPEADEPAHFAQIAGPSKRPRILSVAPEPTSSPPKSKKRATMSASSSRTQSRQRSETLDIESIYRSSRSRSTSTFPPADLLHHRQLWITEDGSPGENFVSAASVVTILSRSYKTYFKNLDDSRDTSFEAESHPATELEYPNSNACGDDPDHYNPIMCQNNHYILSSNSGYLTPAQQALFGTLPTDFYRMFDNTPPSSPLTQLRPVKFPSYDPCGMNHLRLLQRSIRRPPPWAEIPTTPIGPVCTFTSNVLIEAIKSWPSSEIPNRVLMRIIDETCMAKLMPSFTSDIIAATRLHKDSLFMDLGLETCCRSYGIEQLRQMKKRCRMWGLSMGEVELEEGDMLTSRRVTELLPQADVVLVNNKVFQQSLNEALRPRGSYYLHRVDREGYAVIKQQFENQRARSARASRR
ncbi:histone-lysine N-methyltransferase [Suillus subluteus]|nr:histone-lysine N-methyltransferase [Suillus subluteus]